MFSNVRRPTVEEGVHEGGVEFYEDMGTVIGATLHDGKGGERRYIRFVEHHYDGRSRECGVRELYLREEIPEEVKVALWFAFRMGYRIRIHTGDSTGRDDLQEWNVEGRVGCTTGTLRVPILVHGERSLGGLEIFGTDIVRIRHANRREGGDLYLHPSYHTGHFTLEGCRTKLPNGRILMAILRVDGREYARFPDAEAGMRWVKRHFYTGAWGVMNKKEYHSLGLRHYAEPLVLV